MAKHAVKSPSSAERWLGACPGSIKLSEKQPNPSSKYSDEGTAAHFLGATCLQSGTDAAHYLGKVIELLEDEQGEHYEAFREVRPSSVKLLNDFTVDDDMARYVQVYVDYVRDLVKSSGGVLFVEVNVPIDHLTNEEGATGTSDTVILAAEELIVVDLKYGRGVEVSAIENKQERIYGSGALRWIDDLVGGIEKIKHVRMAISQPRVSTLPSEWSCTIEALREFEDEVRAGAALCDEASAAFHDTKHVSFNEWMDKYLHVSEDGCRFCRAKARCPKYDAFVAEELQVDLSGFDALPVVVDQGNNDLLAKHLNAVDLIEGWCKAVRAEAESQLLQGNVVPGYKLVQGRKGNRSWTSKEEAEDLLKKLKLKRDEMYEFSVISPTTAEKLLGKDEKKWPRVLEIITQKDGGFNVAPASDKRHAIEIKPALDGFTPLTD
jgi:hypothetical protein